MISPGISSPLSGKGVLDCYVRNSTRLQVDNWRAEVQIEALPKLAERLGYTPVVWEEQGVSGESLARRMKMQAILLRVARHESQGIVCISFDRLSRDIDLEDGLHIWRVCKDAGAIIVTPDRVWHPGEDADDDAGFINFWLASRENRQRTRTLYEGLVRRASVEPMFRGKTTFGYRRIFVEGTDSKGRRRPRTTWQIDEEVRPVVEFIFQRYPHQSARTLANDLNDKGETWWRKSWDPDGTSHRTPWFTNDLLRLVKMPIYMGVHEFGSQGKSKRFLGVLAGYPGRIIRHAVPELAIVSEDVWLACQGPKPGNPQRARRGEDVHPSSVGAGTILAGILRCPDCGAPMVSHPTKSRLSSGEVYTTPGYVCCTYHRVGRSLCTPHRVHERDVLADLRPILLDTLRRLSHAKVQGYLAETSSAPDATRLERQRRDLEAAKRKLYADRYLHNRVSEEDFERFNSEWTTELARLDTAIVTPIQAPFARLRDLDTILAEADTDEGQHDFLPIDPPGSPTNPDGTSRRMDDQQKEHWRLFLRELVDHIVLGYHANGQSKRADVWVHADQVTWRPDVVHALALTQAAPQPKGGGRRLATSQRARSCTLPVVPVQEHRQALLIAA